MREEAVSTAPYRLVIFSRCEKPGCWRSAPPKWVVISDFEISDALRLAASKSISDNDREQVNRILGDLAFVKRHYLPTAVFGGCPEGLPHDMRYPCPVITIYRILIAKTRKGESAKVSEMETRATFANERCELCEKEPGVTLGGSFGPVRSAALSSAAEATRETHPGRLCFAGDCPEAAGIGGFLGATAKNLLLRYGMGPRGGESRFFVVFPPKKLPSFGNKIPETPGVGFLQMFRDFGLARLVGPDHPEIPKHRGRRFLSNVTATAPKPFAPKKLSSEERGKLLNAEGTSA